MDRNSNTSLILHVKGTAEETTTLPKQVVRQAISQGQLTHSQLIWSTADNAWKQVREMPHLLPSQKLAPAPVPRAGTVPLPNVAAAPAPVPRVGTGPIPRVATGAIPRVATGPIPKVVGAPATQTGAVPRVAATAPVVVSAAAPRVAVAAARPAKKSYVIKDADAGSHPLKWLSIGMGVILLLGTLVNFVLVDHPLTSGMSKTPFSNVTVYAHLGAFVQTNVIVIHVPATTKLTKDNLTDFLVALAQSTPSMPMSDNPYGRVALTSGWTASYTLPGGAWKQLGDMGKDDAAARKETLLDSLSGPAGEPLISAGNKDEATLQAEREKIWDAFAAQFTRP